MTANFVVAEDEVATVQPELPLNDTWSVIVPQRGVPKEPKFDVPQNFIFSGPSNDPNVIGRYSGDGTFSVRRNLFRQASGNTAVVRLGTTQDFALEGVANLDGLGGWFLMMGWDGSNGHILSNSSLRKNDYWRVYSVKEGQCELFSLDVLTDQLLPRGKQPIWITLDDGKLSLRVGQNVIVQNYELDNTQRGDLILGTFRNQYGLKLLQWQSLRVKSLD
ncbi:hypothetical protein [Calycomorphotria hydatis]|uniref:3-keto-disaccharide hydrolase domain-containing protein n=1 Tax=Calycomorphotria hydatis TaxID=2528027 RepID=A0A517T5M5_9PLAN|nr:hypothetical protein [Calycomorphotria hydatis]QDT63686.1 hypothetical protein V22_09110 [Calycomorphotria hydatis]